MSNPIIKRDSQAVTEQAHWTKEQMQLIINTIAKGATRDELDFFLYRCRVLGLDPLKPGQIFFIKYGNSPGAVVVGIDGIRARANRTGKVAGVQRGVIKDKDGKLTGAWAEVRRKDWTDVAREEVPFAEYDTGKNNWIKMPETMIKKVAEAAALRMAFPDEVGDLNIPEEFEKLQDDAKDELPRIAPEQPGAFDGDPGRDLGYRIPFGKYAKRSLEEVSLDDLRSYVDYIERKALKDKQPIQGQVKEFVDRAVAHITAFENGSAIDTESVPF
jgi:phage recombination protein Bet